jgi:hypothetical protein
MKMTLMPEACHLRSASATSSDTMPSISGVSAFMYDAACFDGTLLAEEKGMLAIIDRGVVVPAISRRMKRCIAKERGQRKSVYSASA